MINVAAKNVFKGTVLMLVSSIIFYACDCFQTVSGVILDSETKQPVKNAYTQNSSQNFTHSYTDSSGFFALESISGGLWGCPPMIVVVTKTGYEIKTIEIEPGGYDTVYLEKIR